MANYKAIASGNWSNLAIWQDDSLGYFVASTVLPTSVDNVYSNNFVVTINTSTTVNSLRNVAFTPSFLGAMPIPQMTSNNTPSGVANASSSSAGQPWQAFDRDNVSFWVSNSLNTGWLSYQFPTSKIIKTYGFFTPAITSTRSPKTWTFEGSNDGVTWVVLDTQTNFTIVASTFYSFNTSNTTSYTFYRINITAAQIVGIQPGLATFEMSELLGVLYGPGMADGGNFVVNSSITLNIIAGIIQAYIWQNSSSAYLIQTSGTGITVNMNFSMTTNTSGNTNLRYLTVGHTGTFNFTGTLTGGGGVNQPLLFITSVVTATILGNVIAGNQGYTVLQVNANATVSIIGDIFTNNFTAHQSSNRGLVVNSASASVYVTGNVYHNSLTTTTGPVPVELVVGNLYITGNIIGGFSNVLQWAVYISGNGYFNHTGILTGGSASNTSIGSLGLNQISLGSIAILSGPFVFGNYGAPPFSCTRMFLSSNTSKYIEFASNSTNGALFPSAAPTRLTMYSPNTIADSPVPTNVRQGTIYALGSQTGTLIVPSPSNVRKDIPTDATVGTADLSAADMWNYLTSAITTPGSIGETVKNIKLKTDNIPTYPASVESVGAIVASYNV